MQLGIRKLVWSMGDLCMYSATADGYCMWSVHATGQPMQHPTKMRARQIMKLLTTTKTLLSRDFLVDYSHNRIFDMYLLIFAG